MKNGSDHLLSQLPLPGEAEYEEAAADAVIEAYEKDANNALVRFGRRTGYEAEEEKTPLDALLESPRDQFDELTPEQLADRLERYGFSPPDNLDKADQVALCRAFYHFELETRLQTIRRFADYCGQDGLQPWNVMRNFFACCAHMGLEPYVHLTVREKGLILGESHGSSHFRVQLMCVNLLRRAGARSVLAPGMKGRGASASASKAQKGNSNRKRKIRSRHRRHKKTEKIK